MQLLCSIVFALWPRASPSKRSFGTGGRGHYCWHMCSELLTPPPIGILAILSDFGSPASRFILLAQVRRSSQSFSVLLCVPRPSLSESAPGLPRSSCDRFVSLCRPPRVCSFHSGSPVCLVFLCPHVGFLPCHHHRRIRGAAWRRGDDWHGWDWASAASSSSWAPRGWR